MDKNQPKKQSLFKKQVQNKQVQICQQNGFPTVVQLDLQKQNPTIDHKSESFLKPKMHPNDLGTIDIDQINKQNQELIQNMSQQEFQETLHSIYHNIDPALILKLQKHKNKQMVDQGIQNPKKVDQKVDQKVQFQQSGCSELQQPVQQQNKQSGLDKESNENQVDAILDENYFEANFCNYTALVDLNKQLHFNSSTDLWYCQSDENQKHVQNHNISIDSNLQQSVSFYQIFTYLIKYQNDKENQVIINQLYKIARKLQQYYREGTLEQLAQNGKKYEYSANFQEYISFMVQYNYAVRILMQNFESSSQWQTNLQCQTLLIRLFRKSWSFKTDIFETISQVNSVFWKDFQQQIFNWNFAQQLFKICQFERNVSIIEYFYNLVQVCYNKMTDQQILELIETMMNLETQKSTSNSDFSRWMTKLLTQIFVCKYRLVRHSFQKHKEQINKILDQNVCKASLQLFYLTNSSDLKYSKNNLETLFQAQTSIQQQLQVWASKMADPMARTQKGRGIIVYYSLLSGTKQYQDLVQILNTDIDGIQMVEQIAQQIVNLEFHSLSNKQLNKIVDFYNLLVYKQIYKARKIEGQQLQVVKNTITAEIKNINQFMIYLRLELKKYNKTQGILTAINNQLQNYLKYFLKLVVLTISASNDQHKNEHNVSIDIQLLFRLLSLEQKHDGVQMYPDNLLVIDHHKLGSQNQLIKYIQQSAAISGYCCADTLILLELFTTFNHENCFYFQPDPQPFQQSFINYLTEKQPVPVPELAKIVNHNPTIFEQLRISFIENSFANACFSLIMLIFGCDKFSLEIRIKAWKSIQEYALAIRESLEQLEIPAELFIQLHNKEKNQLVYDLKLFIKKVVMQDQVWLENKSPKQMEESLLLKIMDV